jgi:hypothetical protein
MKLAFTGSRKGITCHQAEVLEALLLNLPLTRDSEAHHGACIGADDDFCGLVAELCTAVRLIAHPSNLPRLTSRRALDLSAVVLPCKPPLERNRDLVDAGVDLLIACPDGPERRRSGTWTTVRRARKLGRSLCVITPQGEKG